ncbi:MAG: two-component regulator propeller domain-containing protein [Flavisolibacter sp.]
MYCLANQLKKNISLRLEKTLILAGFLLLSSRLLAQQYPFVSYTPKDGLVSTRARFMYQDSKGRLYIGTSGGLSIYDGARFTNYTTNNGLSDNLINDVMEMGDDSIWVISNSNKVQCLVHGRLKDFIPEVGYCPLINKLIKHEDGIYYALTDEGIFRFQNRRFTHIVVKDKDGNPIGHYFNKGIESNNKLFIVTDPAIATYPCPSYLVVYDLITGRSCVSAKPPDIYDVIESPQKEILLSTSEGLKAIDKGALARDQIILNTAPLRYRSAASKKASDLYFDREQTLWLTLSEGVGEIDTQGHLKMYTMQNGLPVNLQYSILQDRENIMWFINEQTGISKLSDRYVAFYKEIKPGFTCSDVFADQNSDSVWMMDKEQKKLLVLSHGSSKEFQIRTSSRWLYKFIPGTVCDFLAGDYEIYCCDHSRKTETLEPHLVLSYRNLIAGVPMINFPQKDNQGNLLFTNDKITVVFPNKKIASYPLGYFADQFVITKDNYLWVVTRKNRLLLFRIHPETPDHYFEPIQFTDTSVPNKPRSIAFDTNGNLWIGTRDLGLFRYSVDNGLHLTLRQRITEKEGLSVNCIIHLHGDSEGNIWACSPVGLDRIQERDGKLIIENISRANNIYQSVTKILTTRSGEHWALANTGVIRIKPSIPQPAHLQARLFFTSIKAGRDTLNTTLGQPLMSYKQNDLFFQWAAPSFIDEKQTHFSYRLLGSATNEWSDPSSDASVRFVNLAPGKYVLKVKATFPNGFYPDTECSYRFEILPPWWQTWWFRGVLALTIIVIVLAMVRSYVRRKLEKQKAFLEKKQAVEKERARIASDMHDDLGAGLSTIRFLSDKVRRDPHQVVMKNEIEKIANLSNDMIDSMNEIIWAMNEKNDTLEDLLFYTRSYAKEYCEQHQLACQIDLPASIPAVYVSGDLRRNVFLTVKESLHNIVKYAGATRVEIQMKSAGSLKVQIKDNGKGMTLSDNQRVSTGNGLRNMKRRMESVGGSLILLTGTGVTVIMEVPLGGP